MAFCIIMGTHDFTKQMQEYKGQTFLCRNCGNTSAVARKSWRWFTVCWIPLIPFSFGWDKDVYCPVCRVTEDIKVRNDITSGQAQGHQLQQGGGPGPGRAGGQGGYNGGGYNQGQNQGYYQGGPPQNQQQGNWKQ